MKSATGPSTIAGALLPSGIDAERVREEVERILVSSAFRASKRNCSLLRHIVDCALNGNLEDLKERRLGVEVFSRPADYDTNSDHVVRSVASEVRRRLGQYYMESEADSPLRIELPPGSYLPQFRTHQEPSAPAVVSAAPLNSSGRSKKIWIASAAVGLLLAAAFFASRANPSTPLERFWQPVFSSSVPVLLCAGGGHSEPGSVDSGQPKTVIEFALSPSRRMHTYDAMVLASVTGLLQANGKAYKLLNRASTTSFRELQSGPFVLIGSMNNEWSLRLTKDFRFSFARSEAGARVVDKQNPSNTAWQVNPETPIEQFTRDYAVVSRFRDPQTQQTAVILAGIGPWGSLASGEFVTNPEQMKKLSALAPGDWWNKNFQVVLSTDVIHGSSGPPNIVSTYFW